MSLVFFASFLLLRPYRFVAEARFTVDAGYDSAAEYNVILSELFCCTSRVNMRYSSKSSRKQTHNKATEFGRR